MRIKRANGSVVGSSELPLDVRATPSPAPDVRAESAPRRRRTGKKRLVFSVPHTMPVPVRALWEAATEEERTRAHGLVVAILGNWLGKVNREEAAVSVGLAPVRFWQQCQAALAGMLAGVLRQPRR